MSKIIYFFKKILYKIWRGIVIICTFKNWTIWLSEKWNLFPKYKKGDEAIVHLRNGINICFKFRNNEFCGIDDIWCNKVYTKYKQIQDGDIVIDIGANIGAFSIFAVAAARNVKVLSYEPSPAPFKRFLKNIKMNNLEKNIFPFQLAVAKERGERTLFFDSKGSIGDTITPSQNNLINYKNNPIIVKAITLKDIFEDNNLTHCDFLKMDCEGAEYEILFNTPPEYLQKIENIVVEYHKGSKEIIKILEDLKFLIQLEPWTKHQGLIFGKKRK